MPMKAGALCIQHSKQINFEGNDAYRRCRLHEDIFLQVVFHTLWEKQHVIIYHF